MRLRIPNESLFPKINTLRFRISIAYVAVIGFILILFQGVLYFNYSGYLSREFDDQLQIKADQMGGAVNTFRGLLEGQRQAFTLAAQKALNLGIEYPRYAFMPESPEKFWLADARKLGLDKDFLAVLDSQGNVIAQSSNVTGKLLSFFKRTGKMGLDKKMFYQVNNDQDILRIFIAPYYYAYGQGYAVAVGSSYEPVEWILWRHFLFVLACTTAFIVLASIIVRIFVIRTLSSVMEISKAARDISQENLHARIKLTHADEEIEHLTGSLNEMIGRLEGSFAHVREFSLEMAHEVKIPLAIISGESQLALEKDHSPQEYREVFRTVFKEAQRTQRFVSDLLLLTKLDYRIIKLRFEPIDLSGFLREICEEMRVVFASQGVDIQPDIAPRPIWIKGDRIHLRRVFFNLIDNAMKVTPQGGRISVSAHSGDPKAVISVSDTGCGIAGDRVSKIFNKFYRAAENGRETSSGCGLGLSIVNSIISLHGGNITVHSVLGEGTTFTIELPVFDAAPIRS